MRWVAEGACRCLLILFLLPSSAHAQLGALVGQLPPGTEVRLETVEGQRFEGVVTELDSSSVVLTSRRGQRHRLPQDQLARVWRRATRTGLYARRGAIAGAVAFGGYLGLLAGGLCEEDACAGEYVEGLAVGAPLGALGGAAAGAILGALVSRWEPVHDAAARPVPAETGWRVHLGAVARSPGDGPEPSALIRAAVDREIGRGRRGFMELSHLAYAEEWAGPTGSEAVRDARTWSLAAGLTQSLGAAPEIRVSGSAGLARSSSSIRYLVQPPPGQLETDPVQWGTQIGVGIESGWSLGFAPGIDLGVEARYDYVPLFFDGVAFFTFSAAVWG